LREHIYPNIKSLKRIREFDSWYNRIFMPIFISHDDVDYFMCDPHEQTGGGDYLYTRHEGQREYHIRIRYMELTDAQDEHIGKLYLMSPVDDNHEHRCVYARIKKLHPNVVELQDLVLANNCTDLHKTPPKIGRVYVEVMTEFLISHHKELGINRIELTDNAHYRCPSDRHLSIHLEKSRQLEGYDPYYTQFGYHPKYRGSQQKLEYNKQKMSKIMTRDDYGLKQLCLAHGCNEEVNNYIQTHPDRRISTTLKYVGLYDCVAYYHIYDTLFKNCKLKELDYPVYVMNL
jgi:hypothetical protein